MCNINKYYSKLQKSKVILYFLFCHVRIYSLIVLYLYLRSKTYSAKIGIMQLFACNTLITTKHGKKKLNIWIS
jgi:hypothetical protein